jgi:uncharacterized protein involved in exopolysaccharide biosynthesis
VTVERLTSREFILEVAGELDLINDDMFNSYDPNATDPAWKALIKSLLGMESESLMPTGSRLQNVTEEYEARVGRGGDTGSISVAVDHEVPERAAEIANHIVNKIIALTASESSDDTDEKLAYLSRRWLMRLRNWRMRSGRFNSTASKIAHRRLKASPSVP